MALKTEHSVRPEAPKDGGDDDIQIELQPNRGVIVRKGYSDQRRRTSVKVMMIAMVILCLIPVIFWALSRKRLVSEFPLILAIVLPAWIGYRLFRQFSAGTRSYVLSASHTGLTIETTTWRQRTTRHFTRAQIEDIVLDCSGGPDPHSSLFKSYLVIKSSQCRDIHCLHNVGGDQLARAADALRAALGMPARSWP